MGQRISVCIYFIAVGNEIVGTLSGHDRIHHYGEIASGWVFHPCGNVESADS